MRRARTWMATTTVGMGGLFAIVGCSSTPPACPPGQAWDAATEQCFGQQPACPPGQAWNGAACAMVAGGSCPAGQTFNGSMCVANAPACPAGTTWNGSACAPAFMGGGATCSPAQALDPAATAIAAQGIGLVAPQQVPAGSKPVGQAVAGNFQAGQCLETSIMLNPGKCYSVVAIGTGPTEVDVQLVPQLPGPLAQPIAQDNTTGPLAVLGKAPDCFMWVPPLAAPMKLVLKVSAGQGVAAAQLYER